MPGDLAQQMMAQNSAANAAPVDLAQAMVSQMGATHEIAANTKTVQAFDAMLEELTRIKQPAVTQQPAKTE